MSPALACVSDYRNAALHCSARSRGKHRKAPAMTEIRAAKRKPVPVDFALQGGGSHGAFTWGVLDRLLEEPWLSIEAISGTSAGAMNAAVLADGWLKDGAEGARAALGAYWRRVSDAAAFSLPCSRLLTSVIGYLALLKKLEMPVWVQTGTTFL